MNICGAIFLILFELNAQTKTQQQTNKKLIVI